MFIKKFIKKQLALVLLTFALLAVGLGGTTYALFQKTFTDNKTQSISVGDMNIVFSNGTMQGGQYVELSDSNEVTINGSGTGIMPMSDTDALASNDNIYTFVIYNSGTIAYNYTVKLEDNENYTTNLLSHSYIRYKLTGDMKESINSATTSSIVDSTPDLLSNATNGIIFNYIINPGEVHEFTLRVWVAEAEEYGLPNEALGQEAHLNINIEGEASKNRPAPAPTGWYTASSSTLLGKLRDTYPEGPNTWTIPGKQSTYNNYSSIDIDSSTFENNYWTYGTGYEIVNGNFNLTGVSTLKYSTNFQDLEGKYLIATNVASNSSSTDIQKTGTTGLPNIYKVTRAYENFIVYEAYSIFTFSASDANRDWSYATGHEQTGTYSDAKGKYTLNGIKTVNYANSKDSFEGKLLIGNTAAENYAASPVLTNKTTLYEVIEAGDTYIVYHQPIEGSMGKAEDDYGTSYYFRGAVQNNYVVFANMCWRIVRIDGQGDIKLILYNYDTSASNPCNTSGNSLAFGRYYETYYTSEFNGWYEIVDDVSVRQHHAGLGFMYGTPNSDNYADEHANIYPSTVLQSLMMWYDDYIRTGGYDDDLADVIWCNDKRLPENSNFNPSGYSDANINLGYGQVKGYYRTTERLASNSSWNANATTSPSLKCGENKDDNKLSKFTASDTEYGNGKLNFDNLGYKIGLLTADEAVFAGARYSTINVSYYLNENATSTIWWTSSPSHLTGTFPYEWGVAVYGPIFGYVVSFDYGMRPAVSLKSDVTVTGSGTRTNPFIVQ